MFLLSDSTEALYILKVMFILTTTNSYYLSE